MISASVVLFNTKINLINDVIVSYLPSKERKLYLIDNSPVIKSEYISLSNMEHVEYIYIGKNLGYGGAHNLGIEKAIADGADYHIILNPDIRFNNEILMNMTEYADRNSDVVYMLPKVIYPNGELQYLCKLLPSPMDLFLRRFMPNRGIVKKINDRYILKDFGYNKIINPPCLSGCFMFLRVKTLEEYKMRFDERFFMYCEDFDFIRRLHRIGKTIYYPAVTIIHDHAKESYKSRKMLRCHIASAIKYFNKYGWFFDRERKEMNRTILREITEKD